MRCQKCGGLGYLETYHSWGGKFRPIVEQCPVCKDVAAYTKRVQQVHGEPNKKANGKVVSIRRKKDE